MLSLKNYITPIILGLVSLLSLLWLGCIDQPQSFNEIKEAPEIINPLDQDVISTQIPTFKWTGQNGTANYEFYLNGTVVYTGTDTTFTLSETQKLPMTVSPYTCQVKASNKFQIMESAIHQFHIVDGSKPLIEITSPFSGISVSGLIQIEGTAIDDVAISYAEIQVDDNDWSRIDTLIPVTDYKICNYTYDLDVTYFEPGVHNVTVKAYDESGLVSVPHQIQLLIPDPEQVPELRGPLSNACTKLPTFQWESVAGVESYQIQIALDPSFEDIHIEQNNLTAKEFTPREPLDDGTYHWRVRANKNEEVVTAWSAVNELEVDDIPQPVRIRPVGNEISQTASPVFEWTEVRGTKKYSLMISDDCSFERVVYLKEIPYEHVTLNSKGNVEFRLIDSLYNGSYCWKVVADVGKCLVGTDIPYPWTVNAIGGVGGHWPWCGKLICGSCILWWAPPEDGIAVAYDIQLDDNSDFSSPILDDQITSVSWNTADAGELDPGWYYFRVRAVDADGNVGIWRYCWYHLVRIEDPPVLETPLHEETTCAPIFSWNSVEYATFYTLQVATTSSFGSMLIDAELTELSYEPSVTELPDGTYFWRVQAFRKTEDGEVECTSPWSTTQKVIVAGRIQKTNANDPYYCSSLTDPTPLFTWDGQDNVNGYRLQVRSQSGTYATPVMERLVDHGYTEKSFDYSLPNGYYYWRIQGYSELCDDGEWSDERYFVISNVDPPTLLTPANNEDVCNLFPTFTWEDLAPLVGNVSYVVTIAYDADFTSIYDSYVTNNNYFTPSPALVDDTTYFWKVEARLDAGSGCLVSKESGVRTFTVNSLALPAPVAVSPLNNGQVCSTTPTLLWNMVDSMDSYSIEISNTPTFTKETIKYAEHELNTAYPIPGSKPLNNKSIYYWRLYSSNDGCTGEAGPVYSFVVTEISAPALSSPANGAHITSTSFNFVWQELITAEYYELSISTSPDFATTQVKTNITNNGINAASTGFTLADGNRYYWRVRAFNNTNGGNCVGSYSLGGYFDYK